MLESADRKSNPQFYKLRAKLQDRKESLFYFYDLEKDIEDKMATEFEEHRSRIFEIMSNYKESLSCALEDNVLADLSLAVCILAFHFVNLRTLCM